MRIQMSAMITPGMARLSCRTMCVSGRSPVAIRAAQACEPYSLPPAKYEIWKDIVLNFDPRDMF